MDLIGVIVGALIAFVVVTALNFIAPHCVQIVSTNTVKAKATEGGGAAVASADTESMSAAVVTGEMGSADLFEDLDQEELLTFAEERPASDRDVDFTINDKEILGMLQERSKRPPADESMRA